MKPVLGRPRRFCWLADSSPVSYLRWKARMNLSTKMIHCVVYTLSNLVGLHRPSGSLVASLLYSWHPLGLWTGRSILPVQWKSATNRPKEALKKVSIRCLNEIQTAEAKATGFIRYVKICLANFYLAVANALFLRRYGGQHLRKPKSVRAGVRFRWRLPFTSVRSRIS